MKLLIASPPPKRGRLTHRHRQRFKGSRHFVHVGPRGSMVIDLFYLPKYILAMAIGRVKSLVRQHVKATIMLALMTIATSVGLLGWLELIQHYLTQGVLALGVWMTVKGILRLPRLILSALGLGTHTIAPGRRH